jgi:hypothetical protein
MNKFIVIPNDAPRNLEFSKRAAYAGWFLENSTPNIESINGTSNKNEAIQLRTKYVPMNVFHKESFYLSHYFYGLAGYIDNHTPKAFVKVIFTLKSKVNPDLKPFIVVRTYQIDIKNPVMDNSFVGSYTYRRSDKNQVFDFINSGQGPVFAPRRFLANAYASNFTMNPNLPNLLYSPIREPYQINDVLNSHPDFCYANGTSLDLDPSEFGAGQPTLYDNLSNKVIFMNGIWSSISPAKKNWENVMFTGLGDYLLMETAWFSPDYNSQGNFNECQFLSPKKITITGTPALVNFEKTSFKAGDKVVIGPGVFLKSGTTINSSILGELDSRFESFKNRHIATPSEIEQACNSSQYKNSVKFARIASNDSLSSVGSENNFKALKLDYSIFPNPANNTVTVQAPKDETVISEIVLKNLLGMEVQRFVIKNPSSDVTIDVSTIPVGLYILNVNNFSTRLGIQR